ncbi:LysM peptidoglycan-binding domain-containing protein [Mycobacterium spongiae]|uniref:LysM domain-containing protein n=1 Tax=Mycobacterium spongiae TaxID=886343 RepID=A0A975PWE0_9MYCO|nr:LysM peptidoglycan-binding domain-containing protein [Mycobacterium spongiae]QUR67060.1 hypothetical protein F6B93_08075 [Mycobacterium spongiae]
MTLIHAGAPSTARPRGPFNRPAGPPSVGRARVDRSRRPSPSRPEGPPLCYRGTGVGMSAAAHRRRPVSPATTLALALLAALITVWLGLVAHFGDLVNGGSADSGADMPDRLAVVRVEAGESLRDVAARVAPDAPVREVTSRIRELNALPSTTLATGQTLIAPVG